LEGFGKIIIADFKFDIKPEISFIPQADIEHSLKKDPTCDHVKILWCHSAV